MRELLDTISVSLNAPPRSHKAGEEDLIGRRNGDIPGLERDLPPVSFAEQSTLLEQMAMAQTAPGPERLRNVVVCPISSPCNLLFSSARE